MSVSGTTILVTGGTGSFGRRFIETILRNGSPKVVRVFSRDELKQSEMQRDLRQHDARMRYFIGDVRDPARLERAMEGADIVVHAAALKQVPVCEYNPFEAVKTNILGAQNVIEAALNLGVPRVLALSTDKAANPANLYGATKLCAEKMFTAAVSYVGPRQTKISCVRYGNVIGSRGSVIPLFLSQRSSGVITLTDDRMTRFWITLDEAVSFVMHCLDVMRGGEIFVPKIPACLITDLAAVIAPDATLQVIGVRPGEKIHEVLLTEDEARTAREQERSFVIEPRYPGQGEARWTEGEGLPDGFRYSSDTTPLRLTRQDLSRLIRDYVDIAERHIVTRS